ncbi:transposase family protein, partial [Herbaspirillum sp.]|uniref:transposase family protein n=1 Tax=Herbaspirillum sp. TaxID=1890675 RepID=UPI00258F9117
KKLREQQRAAGLNVRPTATIANHKSPLRTPEEEQQARQETVGSYFHILRSQLPSLLRRLSRIPDPRVPKKTRHKLTMVLIYGMLSFVFQMTSRREANRKMTMPTFQANLKLLIPDFEEIPHHDTLYRLLRRMDPGDLESAHLELVKRLIRNKKFGRHLIKGRYPIAIDGTQKWMREWPFSDEALERRVGVGEQKKSQFYVYVLEACLAFANGMVIPLMSEFLVHRDGEGDAQDCEQKAFDRLAGRLKQRFPRLRILLLLDGLFPNGPRMALCRRYRWQFMIVLQNDCLPSVWEEYEGLRRLQPDDNRWHHPWGNRRQRFMWVNEIEHTYGRHQRRRLILHVVVCEETWQDVDRDGETVERHSRHAWVSSEPLTVHNLHQRCNLAARHRWGIEANILVEKHQGYHYEHCFAYDFNAMRGYHYLMHLGHLFNILARYSQRLQEPIRTHGVRGFFEFLRETVAGPWLEPEALRARFARRCQLRFIS